MSVGGTVEVIESELWPQRDARDPLGIFGWRAGLTGDASGGSMRMVVQVSAAKRHAFVYAIYSQLIAQTEVTTINITLAKYRILTNWPNMDLQAGIQAYSSLAIGDFSGSVNFTAPNASAFDYQLTRPNDRFLLIFDPSTQDGVMDIVHQELAVNANGVDFSFEGYGYYWDRSVMTTPGGPRHPGSS